MHNRTNQKRFMLKFLVSRMGVPTAPTWDCTDEEWRDPADAPRAFPLQSVWRATWGWMAGQGPAAPLNGGPDPGLLHDADHETRALSAAYELAARGEQGVAALARALKGTHGDNLPDDRKITSDSGYQYQEAPAARVAAYGLAAAGAAAVPALVEATRSESPVVRKLAAFALGEVRARADVTRGGVAPALGGMAGDADDQVRVNVQSSLGRSGGAGDALDAVRRGLADPDDEVRIHAAIALARAAGTGTQAPEVAAAALKDTNRYVVGLAVEALDRMGTPEALRSLVPFLKTARWCQFTRTGESIY
jgi:HEAT repeat protein